MNNKVEIEMFINLFKFFFNKILLMIKLHCFSILIHLELQQGYN